MYTYDKLFTMTAMTWCCLYLSTLQKTLIVMDRYVQYKIGWKRFVSSALWCNLKRFTVK